MPGDVCRLGTPVKRTNYTIKHMDLSAICQIPSTLGSANEPSPPADALEREQN